jgi:hypothetical protein
MFKRKRLAGYPDFILPNHSLAAGVSRIRPHLSALASHLAAACVLFLAHLHTGLQAGHCRHSEHEHQQTTSHEFAKQFQQVEVYASWLIRRNRRLKVTDICNHEIK